MPRLFAAIVPPDDVLAHLADRLAARTVPGLAWTPVERWHITLGFFGDDDDPVRREKWLRRRAEGRPAPALRLAGAGTSPGVLWAGVLADDDMMLARLAQAAGAGRRRYRPHVTVARWRSGNPHRETLAGLLDGYSGPWFRPGDMRLMRSVLGSAGPTYTTVATLPLAPG